MYPPKDREQTIEEVKLNTEWNATENRINNVNHTPTMKS
jgi:hypothetical protein